MLKWPSDWSLLYGLSKMESHKKLAIELGVYRRTLSKHIAVVRKRVEGRKCMNYILTSAQISTPVHEKFLSNLEEACRFYDASLLVAGITYNVDETYGTGDARKKGMEEMYDSKIRPYLINKQKRISDDVVFVAELNILPTAKVPLSGLEGYTGCNSTIVPHTKKQMKCVATKAGKLAKQMWTTGTCTLPNYIEKKAGQLGKRHHNIGAVIVQIEDSGIWHIRSISANDDGSFYDLTNKFDNGEVTHGHRVNGIVYGDIHHEKLDMQVAAATWGYTSNIGEVLPNSMLDILKPRNQYFHDLSDFTPRNHHNINHSRFMSENYNNSVEEALKGCSEFLEATYRRWSNSVIIESNHDQAFLKWLDTADIRVEPNPKNKEFYYRCNQLLYKALIEGDKDFNIFEHVLRSNLKRDLTKLVFLKIDESYMRVGIEHGFHGHIGINGSRGSVKQLSKVGPKVSHGHTHTPELFEGAMCAGLSGNYKQGYNFGPSSWWQTHIIEYDDGHRTHVNIIDSRWCSAYPAEAKVD